MTPSPRPLLELENVTAGYGSVEVLRGVSLVIGAGETVALLGANGAGKTTLLRTISGFLAPRSGVIRFAGSAIAGAPPEAIARLGIAHVPEGRRLFPGLTVRENVLVGAANRRVARAELAAEADRVFAFFPELRSCASARSWTLSGGQQQMVALARGLMARPKLLLLDEPSLGLAPRLVKRVFQAIGSLGQQGIAVLLVEQNARLALAVAARGYVMRTGRIATHGTAAELAGSDEEIRAAYLGGDTRPNAPE